MRRSSVAGNVAGDRWKNCRNCRASLRRAPATPRRATTTNRLGFPRPSKPGMPRLPPWPETLPAKPESFRVNSNSGRVNRRCYSNFSTVTLQQLPRVKSDFSEIKFRIYTKFSELLLLVTFTYELRFTRSSRLWTRFDETYNFREKSFSEFGTYKKSTIWPSIIAQIVTENTFRHNATHSRAYIHSD